jgi:hypothetical protein
MAKIKSQKKWDIKRSRAYADETREMELFQKEFHLFQQNFTRFFSFCVYTKSRNRRWIKLRNVFCKVRGRVQNLHPKTWSHLKYSQISLAAFQSYCSIVLFTTYKPLTNFVLNENKTKYLLEKVIKQMNNRSYNINKYNGFLNKLKYKKTTKILKMDNDVSLSFQRNAAMI